MSALIKLENICKQYRTGGELQPVLRNISLTLATGEMTAITGASGSGKSTLMNILGCLDQCTSGDYYFAGKNVAHLSDDARAQLRNQKSVSFSSHFFCCHA